MSVDIRVGVPGEYTLVQTKFPGGESCLRIHGDIPTWHEHGDLDATLILRFEGNEDLFDLALLLDAAKRKFGDIVSRYELMMYYLPYARQDRVCNPGESLSVKVVADFINSLKFDSVTCMDIHSEVGGAVLDNLVHYELNAVAAPITRQNLPSNTVLVSPDAGANKKVLKLAKHLGYKHVVRADKTRDVATGAITGTVVYSEPVGDKDFLIVDDICDGGRTFVELAAELRKLTTGKVMLYVTHGIFSKGVEVFDGLIDKVYIANPVGSTGLLATKHPNVVTFN